MSIAAIGVAGTAKNTGKTTTLVTLLNKFKGESTIAVGLTGIGYDGESFDNVTGLPKPRIDVYEGMFVAVTDRCIKFARAKINPLYQTDIRTALGTIVIGRVMEAGKLVLAGPVKGSDLKKVLELMYGFGAELIFVDGALSRIAPFAETDALIIATGASRNTDISLLAQENEHLIKLLNFPLLAERGRVAHYGSILSDEGLNAFNNIAEASDTICISGLVSGRFLEKILNDFRLNGKLLLFDNAFKLVLAGEISKTWTLIEKKKSDIEIGLRRQLNVIAVTVNPYYPKYHYSTSDYEAAFVDKEKLLYAVKSSMQLPCYDVLAQGPDGLFKDIVNYHRPGN